MLYTKTVLLLFYMSLVFNKLLAMLTPHQSVLIAIIAKILHLGNECTLCYSDAPALSSFWHFFFSKLVDLTSPLSLD